MDCLLENCITTGATSRRRPLLSGPAGAALLVTLAAFLLAPEAHAGKPKLGKTLVDKENGYALKILDDFEAIPLQPGETFTLRKYVGPEVVSAGYVSYNAHLEIVWVPKVEEEAEEEAGGEGEGDPAGGDPETEVKELLKQFQSRNQPRGVWEWAEDNFLGISRQGKEAKLNVSARLTPPGEKRPKKSKIEASYCSIAISSGYGGEAGFMGVMLIVPTEAGELGFFYYHHSSKFADFYPVFLKSFQTLNLIDKEVSITGEDGGEAAFDEYDGEAFRKARKAKLTEGWKAIDTPNYLVIHHVDDKFAKDIGARLEGCRRLYEQLFPPKLEKKAVSVVRVCKDRDEYMHYGAPGGSAGYWSPWDKELVFYEDKSGGKRDTMAVLHHEAFHQYIYYLYGEISPHSWYNEGHGDYFAGFRFDEKNRVKAEKPFLWRTGVVRGYADRGELVPLAEFVRYTQREYYSRADLCYSQGWAFIFFLRQSNSLKPEWRKILDVYLDTIWQETERRRIAREAEQESEAEDAGEGEEGGDPEGGEVGPDGEPGTDEGGDEGSEEDGGLDIEKLMSQFDEDEEILKIAVDAAFSGIDMNELERAFHEFIADNFK